MTITDLETFDVKVHIQSSALYLFGLLFAGCASTADSPHSTAAGVDAPKSVYLLEVTFEWGVGDNLYRTIQTEVEVGKEFYVKVLDRNGNYHAIQGTLQQQKSGEFHLPLRLANWSAMGRTYTTIPLNLRVGGSWGGGSNAGGYGIKLLPRPEKLSVEPHGPENGSQPIRSDTNRTSSAAGSRP